MKKWDKIIIVVALIIGITSTTAMLAQQKVKKNENILIEVNGKLVKTISLNSEEKIYDFKFDDSVGYVEVKDGAVRMLEMDKKICPEGVCSKTGWIEKKYQTIVCLPNKIVVSFGQNNGSSIDELSF